MKCFGVEISDGIVYFRESLKTPRTLMLGFREGVVYSRGSLKTPIMLIHYQTAASP